MPENSFSRLMREDRRLTLLGILVKAPCHEINHMMLRDEADTMGHKVSRDVLLGDLAWLEEQGLVTLEHLESLTIATLTGRGHDVACGRAVVPGVKKPAPGE